MKLFLDMRPAFNPALSPLSGLSFGLAAAAVANGAEDVFFIRDFPRDPELPEATLLPGEFIKWALQSDWEGGGHLRKLADGAVQQGRLDKALVKFESETRVVLLVAPLDSGAMAQFDAAALATEDLSILRFPELLEAPWEQGWREGASALFARADLICCASESVWRDYETIAGEAAPAVITPTPPRLPHANPSAPLPPEQALMMLCDRGILWEPVWAAVREMTEIVGLDWRLELLHGLYGGEPPVIPVDLDGRILSQHIGDFPAL
ncbi:MAG: hypothetical protein KTR21_09980, partial [Rhodobacteraceae bacterium]|nr:hypothetical protein [Paracoccaceae bacterium]